MPAQIFFLGLGFICSAIACALVFAVKPGSPSSLTEVFRRRLMALSFVAFLCLLLTLAGHLAVNRFGVTVDLGVMAVGCVLALATSAVVRTIPGNAAATASALASAHYWPLVMLLLLTSASFIYLADRVNQIVGVHATAAMLWGLLAVLVVAALAYVLTREKADTLAADNDPMPAAARRVLVFYLLVVGVGLIFVLWRVASVDFPDGGVKFEVVAPPEAPDRSAAVVSTSDDPNANAANQPAQPPDDPAKPALRAIIAQASATGVPSAYLLVIGERFTHESQVRINQQPQAATLFIDDRRLQAPVDQRLVDQMVPFSVDVANDKALSQIILIRPVRSEAMDALTGMRLSREMQLLLLALLAGALGSFIHALKSFADYVGNRTLTSSWYWWYITRPFLGAALALVFYAVLRGGFMVGTAADAKAVSPFGVVAIAALVGMFADKASDKLKEVFDTIFTGPDKRGGKLAAPVIDHFDPPSVAPGTAQLKLKISGERLGTVKKVKLNNAERVPDSTGDKLVEVTLTTTDLQTAQTIKVSVVGDNGESPLKDFPVKP